jgi:hypothetical protein
VTEDRRLRDKLAKLADEAPEAGARNLQGPDLVLAILEEIDETILARRLAFRGGDGATLALEVANRRLLGLVEAPEELLAQRDRDRLLAPLPPEDEAALAAFAEVLARFAEGRASLAVAALPLGRPVGAGMTGRSAAAVAEALGRSLYDRAAPLDPAEGFAAGLKALAMASLRVADGVPGPAAGPDAEAVARLGRLDAAAIATLAGEFEGRPGTAPFLLLAAGGAALFLGLRTDGSGVAALLPAAQAGAVAGLWQATGGA